MLEAHASHAGNGGLNPILSCASRASYICTMHDI